MLTVPKAVSVGVAVLVLVATPAWGQSRWGSGSWNRGGGNGFVVPPNTAIVTPGGAVVTTVVPLRPGYATYGNPSVSGQTICQKGEIDAKHPEAFWHEGEPRYGPKYAGMICIGPLQ